MTTPALPIVNAMFGAKLGGLEQVFVDYSEALAARGLRLTNFVAPGALCAAPLRALGQDVVEIGNAGLWDPLAAWRLRQTLVRLRPAAVIAHGNRAIALMRRAARGISPVVAVTHNINVKSAIGAARVIAINDDMRARLVAAGQPEARVARLFNMIRRPAALPAPAAPRSPPVIGAMGRFVAKKGFDVFIAALAQLKAEGRPVRAILAGSGELEPALRAQAAALDLGEALSFPGWVADKAAFFDAIDVFAFPSSHDVCPVVLLEAFLWAKPVVLTDCPGPREISTNGVDSLLFPIGDARALASAIARTLDEPGLALRLGAAAQAKILAEHTFDKAGARLEAIVAAAAEEGA
ncbi:MAG TPA: glycosyltransferase [Roseiarcus sp.]|nr:glycosyltransferase [Roseiarcus sp.]